MTGYDSWKLRSPYDEAVWEEPEECVHTWEIRPDGDAECMDCGERTHATADEVRRYQAALRRAAWMQWRENSIIWRAWRWLKDHLPKRREKFPATDQDIPF